MYEAVVTLHILSGMAWVGGLIVYSLGTPLARREAGERQATSTVERMDKATMWIWPAPFLVIGTGVAQVLMSEHHDWSDLWVMGAIGLVVAAFATGGTNDYLWRKSLKEADGGATRPGVYDRLIRLTWLETLVLIGVVTLMVFKPL